MTLLNRAHGPYYHAYESFDRTQRENVRVENLSAILEYARYHSAYYQNLLKDFSFDASNPHPLLDLPLLTAQELRANLPPVNSNLLTLKDSSYTVFQSGGTTGIPKTSLFTFTEMEMINQGNARGFFACGLNGQDRVANLWAVGGLYMTFIHMNRMLQEYGCMSFPFSNQTPVDFINAVAKEFKINCFTGITSVVLNTLREIFETEGRHLNIDKIYFGGEHIYPADRKEMQDKFGVQSILAPGYGTVDSWYLGYQCSSCPPGVFHAFDDMVYLEVHNEDKNEPCAFGETGMLYATAYHRKLTPILRFRVGDKARFLPETCSCGRTTPLFELLGRGDDTLRIGYDSVDYNFIQSLVLTVPGASGRVQMEKRRRDGRDELILRIETSQPSERYETMSQQLKDAFLNERPSFRDFEKKETIWPLVVEWMAENTLPQNARTGKLVRVIDAL